MREIMGRKRRKRKRKIQRAQVEFIRKILITGMIAVGLYLCFFVYMRFYIRRFDDRLILSGVYVGTADLSGLDQKEAKEQLDQVVKKLSEKEITLVVDDNRQETLTLLDLGFHIDNKEKVLKEAMTYGKKGSTFSRYKAHKKAKNHHLDQRIAVTYKVTPEVLEKAVKQAFHESLKEPQNAKLTGGGGPPAIVEEVYGEAIDVKETTKRVNKFLNNHWDQKAGKIRVKVKKAVPEVLSKDLEEATDLLGTFTTYFGDDGSKRAENVKNGAKKIADTTLMPGKEFSVDQKLEPFTEENGYYESIGYEGDEVVKSIGGGICQVASTLYNAVLLSELEVTTRYAHSLRVHYVEPAFDATVADDTIDFKFKNSLSSPIFIESFVSNGYLTCNIYGKETRDPNRTIEYVNDITGTTPAEKEYKASDDPIGTMTTERNGEEGLSADLYKITYENGVETKREKINHSVYQPLSEKILVGTASDDPQKTQKMKEAIASQNEDMIRKVMEEIVSSNTKKTRQS